MFMSCFKTNTKKDKIFKDHMHYLMGKYSFSVVVAVD